MTHSPLARLRGLLAAERSNLVIALAYSVGIGALSLAVPIGVQALVNTVAFGTVLQPIVVLTFLVAGALTASAVLQCFRAIAIEMVQRRIFLRLASDVTDKLLRAQMEVFDRKLAPDLVNRFLDVVTVQKSFALLLIDGLTVFIQTGVGLCIMAVYHPYLLAFDAFLLIAIVVVLFVFGRGAVRTSIQESYAKYGVLAWLEDIARHNLAFRSQASAMFAVDRADRLVRGYIDARASHFRILLRQIAGSLFLQAAAMASLLGVGGWLVVRGELTLGQLVAAELVLSAVVASLSKFGKSLEAFYDLQAALDKLGGLTDLPTEPLRGETAPVNTRPARVLMKDVGFSFGSRRSVFTGVNLFVAEGSRIGIHGRGAQGKSTLLDLLFGLRPCSSGCIEFDGLDYRDVRLHELRNSIALVRDLDIFSASVVDNVRMGTNADLAQVRSALAQAGVLEAVLALPDGLNTELAAGGSPLAPSEALRLMFARVIVTRPRLLLIDEALDHIADLDTHGPLIRTLFAPDAPWTMIVATENEELWPRLDRVFTLQSGRLVEEREVQGRTVPAGYTGK